MARRPACDGKGDRGVRLTSVLNERHSMCPSNTCGLTLATLVGSSRPVWQLPAGRFHAYLPWACFLTLRKERQLANDYLGSLVTPRYLPT